jgi:hypothetical protein
MKNKNTKRRKFMGKIINDGIPYGGSGASKASSLKYDNTTSGLGSTNVQGAIDEVNNNVTELESDVADIISNLSKVLYIDSFDSSTGTLVTRSADYEG